MSESEPRHPIAVVTHRTRLSPELLRAWERRYAAVTPQRSATGRRLYSDDDIERLRLLKLLTDAGRRISDVAALPLTGLRRLEQEDIESRLGREAAGAQPAPASRSAQERAEQSALLARALAAVEALDRRALEAVLGEAAVALSPRALRSDFIAPLMNIIGQRWHEGSLRVAHEHLASAVVQAFVFTLQQRRPLSPTAPRIVAGTLSGQHHELGVLLAGAEAMEEGWDLTYLGAGLPPEEIAAAARLRAAQAVVLGFTVADDAARIQQELRWLRELLGPTVQLYLGGPTAPSQREFLASIGAVQVPTLAEFGRLLRLKS